MKILQYYPVALAGDFGSAISVRGWSSGLAQAGADVTLAVDGAVSTSPCPEGVRFVPVEHVAGGRFRVPKTISPLIADHDVLVVHGSWALQALAAGWMSSRVRVPYIATPHGGYHPRVLCRRTALKRSWSFLLERQHLDRSLAAHIFFADESTHLDRLKTSAPTIIAPNGVTAPSDMHWDGGSGNYLAWLGRLDIVNKGLDLLLQGLAKLPPSDRPVVRLHGPDYRGGRAVLTQLITRLGLERWVFLGEPLYGEAKWRLLACASGFVLPSRFEACPVALGEAASLGVPAMVGPFPLGRLLIDQGGAIPCSSTAESVASGLRELCSPSAKPIGMRAAQIARESLQWPAVARSWLEQVDDLISKEEPHGQPTVGYSGS